MTFPYLTFLVENNVEADRLANSAVRKKFDILLYLRRRPPVELEGQGIDARRRAIQQLYLDGDLEFVVPANVTQGTANLAFQPDVHVAVKSLREDRRVL